MVSVSMGVRCLACNGKLPRFGAAAEVTDEKRCAACHRVSRHKQPGHCAAFVRRELVDVFEVLSGQREVAAVTSYVQQNVIISFAVFYQLCNLKLFINIQKKTAKV